MADVTTDPREGNLSIWVQERLHALRSALASAVAEARMTEEENDRLRGLLDGKYADTDSTDTVLVNQDTGKAIPLGDGAEIRFGDWATVKYGPQDATGGAHALLIDAGSQVQIRTTINRDTIIVASA